MKIIKIAIIALLIIALISASFLLGQMFRTQPSEPEAKEEINAIPYHERMGQGTYVNGPIPDMEWRGLHRFCQQDAEWGTTAFGNTTLARGGCGVMSLCAASSYQSGEDINPLQAIELISESRYNLPYRSSQVNSYGSDSSLFPEWVAHFGLECRRTNNPLIAAYEMLNRGAVSISKMTSEPLGPGHYVLFCEWRREQNEVVIMDPTIENLLLQPDGIYPEGVMFKACGEYALVYPKGTTGIPSQDEFWSRQARVPCQIQYYDQIENDGWQ